MPRAASREADPLDERKTGRKKNARPTGGGGAGSFHECKQFARLGKQTSPSSLGMMKI